MRNISFSMTTQQVQDQSKDITRRLGWLHLKVGDFLQPVEKCMGLKPGEKIQKLCAPVLVSGVCREPLRRMIDDKAYGTQECRREGFLDLSATEFVDMFCKTHKGCTPETEVTRIEFTYCHA
jgi:hypothetical protein